MRINKYKFLSYLSKKNMTIKEFCEEYKITRSLIYVYFEKVTKVDEIQKICDHLGCKIEDILEEEKGTKVPKKSD